MTLRRAGAVLLLVAASGCCTCGPASFTRRGDAARAPGPAPALGPPEARVLHLADFGDRTRQQRDVARGMEAAHRRAAFDAGVSVGDLVYDCGPDRSLPGAEACRFGPDEATVAPGFVPPADPAFAAHDAPLAFLGDVPVYVALGNHDVATTRSCGGGGAAAARAKACLSVARAAPQWVMPGRHYAVDVGPARLVVLDTNVVAGGYGGFSLDDEVAFVAAQAERCADRPCFVVGHHPPATAGSHLEDETAAVRAGLRRLVEAGRGRFRAWLAGHDHDLQHLRTREGLDVLVAGSTARDRRRERFGAVTPGAELLFASVRWGFGVLEVSRGGWAYRFLDEAGEPVYCCAAAGSGPCRPVRCARD